jgi:hypothetical protein
MENEDGVLSHPGADFIERRLIMDLAQIQRPTSPRK